jgi:hypothetical protein
MFGDSCFELNCLGFVFMIKYDDTFDKLQKCHVMKMQNQIQDLYHGLICKATKL